MYSPRIIEKKLDAFASSNGWMPTYHSIEQVRELKAYVDSVTKTEANSKNKYIDFNRKMKRSEVRQLKRWIENEQVLCSCDAGYFLSRYAFICDEKGDVFQFSSRQSQKVFDAIIAESDESQVAIELLILKARQLGVSTAVALKFIHRLLFIPHTQAVMASVQAEKSELIGRILNICYEYCPWWLVPRRTTERVGKMMEWDNNSVLSIQSGTQPTGIAQGWTPTNIHISEIADIPHPKKVLEEGLLRATHSSRKLFQVWEGTGGGNTGYLADKWRSAKEDWPRGRSRLRPVFLSWPLATDLYPEADWIRKFPVPDSWEPAQETRKHVTRCQAYIRNTDYLARICGENWVMPREQQWFWEFNYQEAVKSHTQKVWLSQMPADDYEALTGKNDAVFEPEIIEVKNTERDRDYTAYAITGMSIDDGFEPDESIVDYNKERIVVTWDSHRGQHFEWIMIPLLPFDENEERYALDKVLIFEEPIPGKDYSIGIDTADGLDKEEEDRSVCSVTRNATGDQQDVQVAEFVSRRVNSAQMVGFAACIGAWYSTGSRDPRGVKWCIEQRERPGDDCQHQLKMMGFGYHHRMIRYDSKLVKENMGQKDGWYTSAWSRPILMTRFVEAINNSWYKPNSRYLISELKDLERKTTSAGKSRLEHQQGKHDDRIFGAALSYITRHHMDVLAERAQKRYAPPSARMPDIDYSYPESGSMSVGL